jgi:hypothetical protein
MLDSECMMLDDQGVNDEWIVRVQGSGIRPGDIETLREWKAEGRLLPSMRRAEPTSIFGQQQRKFPGSSCATGACQSPALAHNRRATLAPQLC